MPSPHLGSPSDRRGCAPCRKRPTYGRPMRQPMLRLLLPWAGKRRMQWPLLMKRRLGSTVKPELLSRPRPTTSRSCRRPLITGSTPRLHLGQLPLACSPSCRPSPSRPHPAWQGPIGSSPPQPRRPHRRGRCCSSASRRAPRPCLRRAAGSGGTPHTTSPCSMRAWRRPLPASPRACTRSCGASCGASGRGWPRRRPSSHRHVIALPAMGREGLTSSPGAWTRAWPRSLGRATRRVRRRRRMRVWRCVSCGG
mmetsp:Transcript_10754/g.37643  ORF Transcript_10754/g.37643 Transcript_10754/m.37643 type:complete len:252 (-) Transcript_10754:543-1298(-)